MQLPKFRGNNLLAIKYGGYFKNELERSLVFENASVMARLNQPIFPPKNARKRKSAENNS